MNEEQTYPATNSRDTHQPDERPRPAGDFMEYFRQYAHDRPEVIALWCLGIGAVVGWKLKIW
jgi:hypothetical protein